MTTPRSAAAVFALCGAALVGFAANSLLCRAALGGEHVDAASFTAIRIGAGALVLFALVRARGDGTSEPRPGSWASGFALFAYAAGFSFAYLRLTTATGALILFATVQATMIAWGVVRGDRPRALEWLGIAIACGGLVALTLPGLAAPDPAGALLMTLAGISWGAYSLRGRGARRPLAATADNFARALPMAAALLVLLPVTGGRISGEGVALAVASGAIASGLGYTLWYAALPHLAAVRAAVLQLAVPVLAATAGAVILDEAITLRLAGATVAILGGIALASIARRRS